MDLGRQFPDSGDTHCPRAPLHGSPHRSRVSVAPSFRRSRPAHIFQMTPSLPEPGLCLEVFFFILCCCFFPSWTQEPVQATFASPARYTNSRPRKRKRHTLPRRRWGHSAMLNHTSDRHSSPLGRKIGRTQTRPRFGTPLAEKSWAVFLFVPSLRGRFSWPRGQASRPQEGSSCPFPPRSPSSLCCSFSCSSHLEP